MWRTQANFRSWGRKILPDLTWPLQCSHPPCSTSLPLHHTAVGRHSQAPHVLLASAVLLIWFFSLWCVPTQARKESRASWTQTFSLNHRIDTEISSCWDLCPWPLEAAPLSWTHLYLLAFPSAGHTSTSRKWSLTEQMATCTTSLHSSSLTSAHQVGKGFYGDKFKSLHHHSPAVGLADQVTWSSAASFFSCGKWWKQLGYSENNQRERTPSCHHGASCALHK